MTTMILPFFYFLVFHLTKKQFLKKNIQRFNTWFLYLFIEESGAFFTGRIVQTHILFVLGLRLQEGRCSEPKSQH